VTLHRLASLRNVFQLYITHLRLHACFSSFSNYCCHVQTTWECPAGFSSRNLTSPDAPLGDAALLEAHEEQVLRRQRDRSTEVSDASLGTYEPKVNGAKRSYMCTISFRLATRHLGLFFWKRNVRKGAGTALELRPSFLNA
jgi:hypothetical protein